MPTARLTIIPLTLGPRSCQIVVKRRSEADAPARRLASREDAKIERRTRVVGTFTDGQSALNLAAARLRHIAGTAWSTKRYLNIELLKDQQMRGAIIA
jgi:hypothetical protein